jgi:hypothetical protein
MNQATTPDLPGSDTLVALHQGAIGDFLLALSVVQSVQETIHASQVVAVASSPVARLTAGRSVITSHVLPDQVGLHTLFRDGPEINDRLRALLAGARYVLSFFGGADSPLHARLRSAAHGTVISIDPRPSADTLARRRHITTQWADSIRNTGLDIPTPGAAMVQLSGCPIPKGWGTESATRMNADMSGNPTSQENSMPGSSLITHHSSPSSSGGRHRPRVVIHPGSGGRAKCWPFDRFLAVADSLSDIDVSWMLGPAECENPNTLAAARTRAAVTGERLIVEDDLINAANRIVEVDCYLGNDAGVTHLAAALGVPTIAIFGPTDPAVWRPLGDRVTIIAPSRPASAIDHIPVQEVQQAICAVIARL